MRGSLGWSALAAILALAPPAKAQLGVEARLGGAIDSLRTQAGEAGSRTPVSGSLEPAWAWADGRGRVTYSLAAGAYASDGDWSFVGHGLELLYRADLGETGRVRLFLAGGASLRRNGSAWAEADYDALAARVNLELRPGPGLTLRTGARLVERRFAALPSLDQGEQSVFLSLHRVLQTRTTLTGELQAGWKSYAGYAQSDGTDPGSTDGSALPVGTGRGGGLGPALRFPALVAERASVTGPRARQWGWLARAAQSLGERTGVSLQYLERRSAGQVPPALVTTPAGFFDDGVYDDPFASDLRTWTARLKHVFPGAASAEAWASRQRKPFTGLAALDSAGTAGEAARLDRISRAGLDVSLPLFAGRTGRADLALEAGYGCTRHRSNDAFYDYTSHAFGLSLRLVY